MAHFFKPPSQQVVQVFQIPLGETWDVALWGIDNITGNLKPAVRDNQIAVAAVLPFPPKAGVLQFTLQALKMGRTTIEGKNAGGRPWAAAEIVVVPPRSVDTAIGGLEQEILAPGINYSVFPNYIDKVKRGRYDVGSSEFTVDHEDGTTVDLPYGKILSDVKASSAPGAGPPGSRTVGGLSGYLRDRRTQKIHPLVYNEQTTPNLAAMVLETDECVQNSQTLFHIANAVLEILAVYAAVKAASGGVRPNWRVAAAKGPAGRPKLAPNIIQGDPPMVKIGKFGEPGNLAAHIETGAAGEVVYKVEAIVLQGEGNAAEIATARLAHREMIVRAAQRAQQAGQKLFKLRGGQANPNFRAHADKLAKDLGVAGSGKSIDRVGTYTDYEVTLDVAKVLGSQ